MLERTRIKDRRCRMIQKKLTLKEYVEVISNSEEVINVIPLAVKSPIVSWNPYCKGGVGYYEIHKADGSYKTYIFFSEMLNDFDKEDLIVLYRLLNEKYASTRPSFDNLMLWGDLKIIVHSLMLGKLKDVQINHVQAVDASLVVMKSSRIESENNSSKNAQSKLVNETQMQMQEGKLDMGKALDVGLVVTESSGTKSDKQNTSSKSGNYTTHTVDADIRLVNNQEPFAEVQLTAQHNVLANEQQLPEQYKPIYNTYLLKKVNSNTTHDSTNMSHRGGEIDQNAKKCPSYKSFT
ncbi:hypothetical protein Tco_1498967 [Tanacetum coccineum]